jgi:hypothetical protein
MAYADSEHAGQIVDQLVGLVSGACADAELEASRDDQPYGRTMLQLVQKKLREASADKVLAMNQPYECLVGVAGLLTDECRVWWGKKFAVGGGS